MVAREPSLKIADAPKGNAIVYEGSVQLGQALGKRQSNPQAESSFIFRFWSAIVPAMSSQPLLGPFAVLRSTGHAAALKSPNSCLNIVT